MKKIAALWLGYLTLVVLSACNPKDIPAGPGPDPKPATGEAEIVLPSLPPDFLAKASAQQADAMFILTISGPGMVPRKQAWPLGAASGAPLKVTGIPVGSRLFTGQLESEGNITHADSVWASVESGKTAQVNLKLARVAGNARICVEIEGLPLPAGCQKPNPLPDLSGCWRFSLGGPDSGASVLMRLGQKDTLLWGEIVMPDGQVDSSIGMVGPGGWVSMGVHSPVQGWVFSGGYDSTKGALTGKFYRRYGEPYGVVFITAYRVSCGIIIDPIPQPRPDSQLACYDVKQFLDGAWVGGRLAYLEDSTGLHGFFQWQGVTAMPISGHIEGVNGNRGLYMYGNLPYGLSAAPPGGSDPVHYKGQIKSTADPILYGTIYSQSSLNAAGQRGTWSGNAGACLPKDFSLIRAMHNL